MIDIFLNTLPLSAIINNYTVQILINRILSQTEIYQIIFQKILEAMLR